MTVYMVYKHSKAQREEGRTHVAQVVSTLVPIFSEISIFDILMLNNMFASRGLLFMCPGGYQNCRLLKLYPKLAASLATLHITFS